MAESARFDLFKKILTDGNDVTIVNDLELREWLKKNPDFQNLKYHFAKEVLASVPSPIIWVIENLWVRLIIPKSTFENKIVVSNIP